MKRRGLKSLVLGAIVLSAVSACASQPVGRQQGAAPLEAVSAVDLNRYMGRWYEFARLPNSFERDCQGVTADYSLKPDGGVTVVNTCRKGAPSGPVDVAQGRARVVDTASRAKLQVSFFWEFWGNYWVIDLDPDYRWALVGEPEGRYFWILTRDPVPSDALKADLLRRAAALGYQTERLEFPRQPPAA